SCATITVATNLPGIPPGGMVLTNAFTNMCPKLFSVTRTWRATDACSNTAFCSQTVTIVDTEPPNLVCRPNKSVECGTDWSFDIPTAVDKCKTNVTITIFTNLAGIPVGGTDLTNNFTNMCPKLSSVTRTWRAMDACGNVAFCNQTVTIVDTTPPHLTCGPSLFIPCGTPLVFTRP